MLGNPPPSPSLSLQNLHEPHHAPPTKPRAAVKIKRLPKTKPPPPPPEDNVGAQPSQSTRPPKTLGGPKLPKSRPKPPPPPPPVEEIRVNLGDDQSRGSSRASTRRKSRRRSTAGSRRSMNNLMGEDDWSQSTSSSRRTPRPPSHSPPPPGKSIVSGGSVKSGGDDARSIRSNRSLGSRGSTSTRSRGGTRRPPPPSSPSPMQEKKMKKRLSGADIVREDLKRQIMESQDRIWRLKNERKRQTDRCARNTSKLDQLNKPTSVCVLLKEETDDFKTKVHELKTQLAEAGEKFTEMDDVELKGQLDMIEDLKKKLRKIRSDKDFILGTLTELIGGEGALSSLIESAKKKEKMSISHKGSVDNGASRAIEVKNKEYAEKYRRSSEMDPGSWTHIKKVYDGRLLVVGPGKKICEELLTGIRNTGGKLELQNMKYGNGESEELARIHQWQEYNSKMGADGNYFDDRYDSSSFNLMDMRRSISPHLHFRHSGNSGGGAAADNSTRPMHKITANNFSLDYGHETHQSPNGVGGHVMLGSKNPYVDRLRTSSTQEFGTWKDSYQHQHEDLTKKLQSQLDNLKDAEVTNRSMMSISDFNY